jgi:hypothetical protein
MSTTTVTQAQALAAIDSMVVGMQTLRAYIAEPVAVTAVAAKAAPKAPAKVTRKAPAKAARFLRKAQLPAFKAAARKEGVDMTGMSTKDCAAFCIDTDWTPKGWVVGEGYRALLAA